MKRALALLAAFMLLASCAGWWGGGGGLGVLTLQNQRSGERATVTYRTPQGQLVPQGLDQINYLMRDMNTGQSAAMDIKLLDFLGAVRQSLGMPAGAVIVITSAYRSPSTNASLRQQTGRAAENSYHIRGQAIDFKIPGVPGPKVAEAARSLHRGGVAYYPASGHVHIDTGPDRTWTVH